MLSVQDSSIFLWLTLHGLSLLCGTLVMFTANWRNWYNFELNKAPLSLPNRAFAPAWFSIWLLKSFAAWLAYRSQEGRDGLWVGCLVTIIASALLEAYWPFAFFGRRMIAQALYVLLLDLAALAAFLGCAFSNDRIVSGALVAPVAAYVLYATYLNAYAVAKNELEEVAASIEVEMDDQS